MKKLADIKSPVKIQKLMCHEDGTSLINDYTMVQPMKPYDISFQFKEFDNIVSAVSSIPIEISSLFNSSQCVPHSDIFYAVTGYIEIGDAKLKSVCTRRGVSRVKEDLVITDQSGKVPLHVWEDALPQIKNGGTFTLSYILLKRYHTLYSATTSKTTIVETKLDYSKPAFIDEGCEKYVISRFITVCNTEIFKICRKCDCSIPIAGKDARMKCNHCGVTAWVSDLHTGMKTTATFSQDKDDNEFTVVISTKPLRKILQYCKKDLSNITEDVVDDSIFDVEGNIGVTVKDGLLFILLFYLFYIQLYQEVPSENCVCIV